MQIKLKSIINEGQSMDAQVAKVPFDDQPPVELRCSAGMAFRLLLECQKAI